MADVLVSALLSVLMKKATDQVIRQFGVLWGITEKLEELERKLLAIQCIIGNAEERQGDEDHVKRWLEALKDTAYRADDILDEFNVDVMRLNQAGMTKKVRYFFSSYNPVWFRFQIGRKLNDIIGKMDRIITEGRDFHFTATTQPQSRDRRPKTPTHSYVDESTVIGREEDEEKIVKLLLDHDNSQKVAVLPIVGMGGLGKTTLAKLVREDKRVQEHFQPRIWVCVSDEFELVKLAKAIITSATDKECQLSTMELLQRRLRDELSGKRYFLVLDDVWNNDSEKWNRLKTFLETGKEGSKIIVTTRSEKVACMMGTIHPYFPQKLNENDSWALFKKRAFEDRAEEPQNLVSIGKDIVKKCDGLPLALNVMGGLMQPKNQEPEWLSVKNSKMWNSQAGDSILSVLRLSYGDLPSQLKQCFAFCAIFPKGHVMEKEMLIQLWMANGFIPSDEEEELQDKGNEIFNELACRSFFQDIKEDKGAYGVFYEKTTCKMHDLMHDLAQSIMGKECLSNLDHVRWEHISKVTRHLYVPWNYQSDRPRTLNNFLNIRTLLMSDRFAGIAVTEESLKSMPLRAFELNGANITQMFNVIRYLKHLRYLDLSNTVVAALPEAISTLFNLQTLNLSSCPSLRKLPDGMKNMSNLRYLCINGCPDLKELWIHSSRNFNGSSPSPSSFSSSGDEELLPNLKKLRILDCDGLLKLPKLPASLISLYVDRCANLISLTEGGLQHVTALKELRIDNCNSLTSLPGLGSLTALQDLFVSTCRSLTSLPGDLGSLIALRNLYIHNCESLTSLPRDLGSLIALRNLYIHCCESLTSIPRDLGSLIALQDLSIWSCRSLTSLLGDLGSLTALQELSIFDCESLTFLPGDLGSLTALQKLSISYCGSLTSLPGDLRFLTALQELSIGNCRSLTSLPGDLRFLSALQNLFIWSCGSLTSLPRDLRFLTALQNLSITDCGSLTSLPDLGSLTALRELFISNCGSLTSLPEDLGSLTALQELSIMYCGSLTSLPGDLGSLTALRKLFISDCESLTSLSEDLGSLTALQELSITSCESLTSLSGDLGSLIALQDLSILSCRSLTSLPEDLGSLTALQELSISQCENLTSLPGDLASLTALQELSISQCESLTSLPGGLGSLTALQDLSISFCKSLTSLPEDLGSLTALRELCIFNCESLTSLPRYLGSLTALQKLYISFCGSLTSLPRYLGSLTALRELSISSCESLTSLPRDLGSLIALQDLSIHNCKNLTFLPEDLGSLTALQKLSISDFGSLTSLPGDLGSLTALRELFISDCGSLTSLLGDMGSLTALHNLSICNCGSLTSLSGDLGSLTALQNLSICNCGSLTSLPGDLGSLTTLQNLSISNCGSLTSLPGDLGSLTTLQELSISNCGSLTSLPRDLGSLTALQKLSILYCALLPSLPEGLQRRLSSLQYVHIEGCPNLEDWHYTSEGPNLEEDSGLPYSGVISKRSTCNTFLPSFRCFRRASTK